MEFTISPESSRADKEALVAGHDGAGLCDALREVLSSASDDSDFRVVSMINVLMLDSALVKLADAASTLGAVSQEVLGRRDAVSEKFLELLARMAQRDLLSEDTAVTLSRESLAPLVAHDKVSLAEASMGVLVKLASTFPRSIVSTLSPPTSIITSLSSSFDSTVRIRFATLHARVLESSSECFARCRASGFADQVLQLCQSDDVLTTLVALELLQSFGRTLSGYSFLLNNSQVLPYLMELVCGGATGEPDPMLGDTALRALGQVLAAASTLQDDTAAPEEAIPSLWEFVDIDKFCRGVTHLLDSNDETQQLAGLAAVCDLGCASSDGLATLVTKTSLIEAALGLLTKKPSAQAACLHALAKALEASHARCGDTGEGHPEFYLRKKLYDAIGASRGDASTTAYLFTLLQKPIDELRNGVYHMLVATVVALPHFSALALFQADTLRTFWFERTTEFTKEGREWKFALLQSLQECPAFSDLRPQDMRAVSKYVKEGPFFSEPRFAEPLTM